MDIIISGILGRMGRAVLEAAEGEPGFNVVCGVDTGAPGAPVLFRGKELPVAAGYGECADSAGLADAIIDFSHYTALPSLLGFATAHGLPAVVATTALGEDGNGRLAEAAKAIPVFNSSNMSLGVAIMKRLAQLAAPALEDSFNIEIIEAHHSMKKDSPSGTALLLADAINESCAKKKDYVFGRHGKDDDPKLSELGIHSVRGGTLPGRHTIMFAGPDEVIELTHTAYSRRIFALGALKAARYIADKPAGLYSMDDLVG